MRRKSSSYCKAQIDQFLTHDEETPDYGDGFHTDRPLHKSKNTVFGSMFSKKGIIREGYKKNELRRSRGGSHTNHIINNTKTNNQSLLST